MNYKNGDLIIENLSDSLYSLIILTEVRGNKADGYIIDEVELTDDGFSVSDYDNPVKTGTERGGSEINLNEVELIEKASALPSKV